LVALASSIATNIFPSPDGMRLFVVNTVPAPTYGGSVTAIDVATGRTIATYRTTYTLMGQFLWTAPAFAFSADGSKFFVASCQIAGCTSLSANGYVEEFDITSTKEIGNLAVPGSVSQIMASPDGESLYIIHSSTMSGYLELTAVALPSLATAQSIPLLLPDFAFSSTIGVINPSGSTLYVASPIKLTAINLPDLTLRNSVPLSLATEAIAISANGSRLGLLQTNFPNSFNEEPGIVSFVDPTTLAISSVQISLEPLSALALDPAGSFAYAGPARGSSNAVSMLDQVSAQSLSATRSIPVDGLLDLALSPSGQSLYTLLGSGTTLAAFNSPNPIPTSITLSSEFQGLSISPDGETLFASPRNFNGLLVKSASTGATIAQYLPTSPVYATAVKPRRKSRVRSHCFEHNRCSRRIQRSDSAEL
jgi:DNA-binding beta-propeller fold protein YncE